MSKRIATHEQPPNADFLIHADLGAHGMADALEELWVKQVDERRFVMRSLPFFTYGIALNDEVETDADFLVREVARPSGHRVLRVAAETEAAQEFHAEFHPLLDDEELLHEWRGLGYVSIDLPPGRDVSRLSGWLEARADSGGLHHEYG